MIAAILTLRDQVISPILAGVRSPRLGGKPATWTAIDRDYERLRIDMHTLFKRPRHYHHRSRHSIDNFCRSPFLKRLAGDVMFAVITPDGRLVMRAALGRASDTQWGPTRSIMPVECGSGRSISAEDRRGVAVVCWVRGSRDRWPGPVPLGDAPAGAGQGNSRAVGVPAVGEIHSAGRAGATGPGLLTQQGRPSFPKPAWDYRSSTSAG